MTGSIRRWLACGMLLAAVFPPGRAEAARPQVAVIRARVEGRPEATAPLERLVATARGRIAACYDLARRNEPGLVGRLYLEVTLAKTGRVKQVVATRASTVPRSLTQCVIRALEGAAAPGWTLPNPVVATVAVEFRLTGRVFKGVVARGGLLPEWLAGVFEARVGELGICLPQGERRKVLVSGVIRFDGTVQRVRVRGRRLPRALRSCVEREVAKWRFPFGRKGHRTWFQYPATVVGGPPARPPQARPADLHPLPRTAPRAARTGPRPRPGGHGAGRAARSVAAPKVGLLEIRVGSTRIPGGVDDKALGRLLHRVIERMKRCGGLKLGSRFQLAILVAPDGKPRLEAVGKRRPPKQAWSCLARALRGRRFPVSATRRRGYKIDIQVHQPGHQSGLRGR